MYWVRGGTKGTEATSCSCSLHVSIGMRACQGEIICCQKPCNYQLPLSLFHRKTVSNFVPILTDENFFRGPLFISISFNYCLSTMLFIQLSATLSAKWFKMQWHAGETMFANNELITATSFFSAIQSIFFWVSYYLKIIWLPLFPLSLHFRFHPRLSRGEQ